MTFNLTSPTVEGSRKFRATSIGLFALLAGANAHAVCVHHRSYVYTDWSQSRLATTVPRDDQPRVYLASVGAVPLRFAPPPPVATERPKPIVPIAEPAPASTSKPEPLHVEPAPVSSTVLPEEHHGDEPPVSTGPTPPRILPDDTPRDLRAEDVLPYFQLSNDSNPDAGVAVPFTPATPAQPQSSATYQLK